MEIIKLVDGKIQITLDRSESIETLSEILNDLNTPLTQNLNRELIESVVIDTSKEIEKSCSKPISEINESDVVDFYSSVKIDDMDSTENIKSNNQSTLIDMPIGSTLYSSIYGKCTLVNIDLNSEYPLEVKIPHRKLELDFFTKDGKLSTLHKYPTLFPSLELLLKTMRSIKLEDLPNLEVDTLLEVRNSVTIKPLLRYFAQFDETGDVYCYPEGATSLSHDGRKLIKWTDWKVYDKDANNE